MFGFLVIFLLSTLTTQQTDGLPRIEKRMLTPPEEAREEKKYYVYNPYTNQRIDNYDSWEANREEDRDDAGGVTFVDDDEQYEERDSRRLFEWFSRLFQSTTPGAGQSTTTTTESSYQRELKDRIFLRALHHNLTEVLFRLSDIEKRVTTAMELKESYAILTKGKPQVLGLDKKFYYHNRLKRDVSELVKSDIVTNSSIESDNATKGLEEGVVGLNATECNCNNNVTSGRRAGYPSHTPTEVKNKLLFYIQESFQEINTKIMSLKNLKQVFSDNISFKVGYILANIDTLEVSMLNLKRNMEKNQEFWEDSKILELYDTLRVSNQAVSGLIESLKMYLQKLSQPQAKPEISLG